MARYQKITASVRVAIRVYDSLYQTQIEWRNQGVDYNLIDLGPEKRGPYQKGDTRVITFAVDGEYKTPFARVYLTLGDWGWAAHKYEYRKLDWFQDVYQAKPGEVTFHSDFRCSPVVDYYQFSESWTTVELSPSVTERPVIF